MIATISSPRNRRSSIVGLENGAAMSQSEFHDLYSQAPPSFRAELIGGVVYVPSPVSLSHGEYHALLIGILFPYQLATAGVQVVDNSSVILGRKDEPQPDISIRIKPEYGGQSGTTLEDFIRGAPELIIEVANSSRSLDLNTKRSRYKSRGVCEYFVVNLRDRKVHWYDFVHGKELKVGSEGIVQMKSMPGLWIDSLALFRKDGVALLATMNRGLASTEHATFVQKLASAKSK